jgi:hypothetical protein
VQKCWASYLQLCLGPYPDPARGPGPRQGSDSLHWNLQRSVALQAKSPGVSLRDSHISKPSHHECESLRRDFGSVPGLDGALLSFFLWAMVHETFHGNCLPASYAVWSGEVLAQIVSGAKQPDHAASPPPPCALAVAWRVLPTCVARSVSIAVKSTARYQPISQSPVTYCLEEADAVEAAVVEKAPH